MSLYAALGVRRVINACGIYTDLGGSVLAGAAWAAASEANATWAALDELLERSGERIAQLCGAQAARVVPGASAGLALSIAACVADGSGPVAEALPLVDSVVLLQRAHAASYRYARCASLAGARLELVDDPTRVDGGAAAILHPAHLDGAGMPLAAVARTARVPVVVDAAYLSFPVSELARWSALGDLVCFSAKYFWGPNAGGFVAGRSRWVRALAALDFTGYETGPWRNFGRAFKLDRATVAATVAALEAWVADDHEARLRGYTALAERLAERCGAFGSVKLKQFTLDERVVDGPVNAVVLSGARDASAVCTALAAGDPSVRAMVDGDALVFCTEALRSGEIEEIAAALGTAWFA